MDHVKLRINGPFNNQPGRLPDSPSLWQNILSPLVCVALALFAGIIGGYLIRFVLLWAVLSAAVVIMMLVMAGLRRGRGVRCWGLFAVIALGGLWTILQSSYLPTNSIVGYILPQRQLARVTGVVQGPVVQTLPAHGPFAEFSYRQPGTRFVLLVKSIKVNGPITPATGKLMVYIRQADGGISAGALVTATGWLSALRGPTNPGEFDYKNYLVQRRGIYGSLVLDNSGQMRVASRNQPYLSWSEKLYGSWQSFHFFMQQKAREALDVGIAPGPVRSMLDSLLLGQKSAHYYQVRDMYLNAGLMDLMAISGTHLGLLLALVWVAVRVLIKDPAKTGFCVLAVLLAYLTIVPWQVPILRTAVMAAIFCLGYMSCRKTPSLDLLAIAAIVILLFQPNDLFTAGFQLSFGIVAALVLFTGPVADRFCPRPDFDSYHPSLLWHAGRYAADIVAMSVVAFCIAAPLVMYHFQMTHPWTFFMHIISMYGFAPVILFGYIKILMGMIFLPLAYLLTWPLAMAGTLLFNIVSWGAGLPWASVHVAATPVVWVFVMVFCISAFFEGMFRRRRMALALVAIILISWTWSINHPRRLQAWAGYRLPAMTVTMFDVGNGSCYLLQSRGKALMFDCGSHSDLNVGARSIVPALVYFHVHKIDTLFVSHGDLDHFDGVLEVADQMGIGQVVTTPQVMAIAQTDRTGAVALLINGLRQRRIPIKTISRGWHEQAGQMQIAALWPPRRFKAKIDNNASLVLSVKAGGRRLLLSGDIQDKAMEGLFARHTHLRADIAELPHHGSLVNDSRQWLAKVNPKIIFQSTGIARLHPDKWQKIFAHTKIRRLVSAQVGMAQVKVSPTGKLKITTFLSDAD